LIGWEPDRSRGTIAVATAVDSRGRLIMMDMTPEFADQPLRPGDFARVLLASSGDPPRARARDQQADMIGEAIKRRVLNRLVALDPEPESLEATLLTIIQELGEPSGSTRAVCTAIADEWEMARQSPGFWGYLIGQAMRADEQPAPARKNRGSSPG
jgi:hypothetical protein